MTFDLEFFVSLYENWGGRNERWLRGEDSWYFITPDGLLFRWDESDKANGVQVATLAPLFYEVPELLYNASDESLVYQIGRAHV